MGRYGTESGREKDARHFFSFQTASCHEAYVVVVMSYLVEGPNRQVKTRQIKKTQHFGQNHLIKCLPNFPAIWLSMNQDTLVVKGKGMYQRGTDLSDNRLDRVE